MIKKSYTDPIYKVKVKFYTDCTDEEFLYELEKDRITVNIPVLGNQGVCFPLKYTNRNGESKKWYYVWSENDNFPAIAHEALHLVGYVFDEKGIEFSHKNSEGVAYYFEFWLNKFINTINDKKKANHRRRTAKSK